VEIKEGGTTIRKLNSLHPLLAFFYWDFRNNFRLAVITKDGRNVLLTSILLFAGILGAFLGLIYGGALWFRGFAEEKGFIDAFGFFYGTVGFSFLGMSSLILGAILSISGALYQEEERDLWLRSLLTERDFSFYQGAGGLLLTGLFLILSLGVPLLLLGKVVLRLDPAVFFAAGLVILLVITSFLILGNLLMSLVVICIPPRLRQRILVGTAVFIIASLIVPALYLAFLWEGDIEALFISLVDILTNPYLPTAWGVELFSLVRAKGWLAGESLMRLVGLIGLGVVGIVALRRIWPLTFRPAEWSKQIPADLDISLPVRWDTKFAAMLGRLPLDHSTKAFLKRDLILFLRYPAVFINTIFTMGLILVVVPLLGAFAGLFYALFLLYLVPGEFMSQFLHPSLKTEGSNMDYIRMLLEKRKFIGAKIASTFLVTLVLSLIIVSWGFAVVPALEWDFVSIVIRILIITMAVLQASLLGMVFGEKILISGKQSIDRGIAYFFLGVLLAKNLVMFDLYLTNPQMLPWWAGALLPHLPLIIFAGVISYCLFRLRKFARAMEDV